MLTPKQVASVIADSFNMRPERTPLRITTKQLEKLSHQEHVRRAFISLLTKELDIHDIVITDIGNGDYGLLDPESLTSAPIINLISPLINSNEKQDSSN